MPKTKLSLEDRFWEKVQPTGFCWEWTAYRHPEGYGRFKVGALCVQAHRWAYEHLIGPIEGEMELDHLCRNRGCVNPDHLEPVSTQENIRRGRLWAIHGAKTHCPAGHPYSGDNLYVKPSGQRVCRACKNAQQRARRATSRV